MGWIYILYIREVKVHLQFRNAGIIGSAAPLEGDLRHREV